MEPYLSFRDSIPELRPPWTPRYCYQAPRQRALLQVGLIRLKGGSLPGPHRSVQPQATGWKQDRAKHQESRLEQPADAGKWKIREDSLSEINFS